MSNATKKVASTDGTPVAFDRLGDGPPVVLVCGAMCDRALMRPTAEELAKNFTVINYDRRGRGDSGDAAPYAIEREVEDLAALIEEAGGSASVYGHSSGAGLALHAAAGGLPIDKMVLHEPPYTADDERERRTAREFAASLEVALSENRWGDAVELFSTTVGMPPEMVEAMAPTLAYDSEIKGDRAGGAVPDDLIGRVTTETLVLVGGASPGWTIEVGNRVADVLPNGRLQVLDGREHVVPPALLAPVLAGFFAGDVRRTGERKRRGALDRGGGRSLVGASGGAELWAGISDPARGPRPRSEARSIPKTRTRPGVRGPKEEPTR